MKKRAAQQAKISKAEELIGKRLVLWDETESKWRHLLVNDLTINWIENGLVAQIIHKIQEFNEVNDPIGREKEIHLDKFKYFLSPIQSFDEQLIRKLKEKLKWEQEIAQLEEKSKQEQSDCDRIAQKYQKKSWKYYQTMRQQILDRFEASVSEQAEVAAKKSKAKKRILEEYYPEVMLDMRKGLIEIDLEKESQGNVRKLAKQIARERYLKDWTEEKRQDLQQKLQEKEQEMKEAIEQKHREMQQRKLQIQQHYRQEVENIKVFLRKQYQIHKNRLIEQAKFPKEVFAKVLPISYHCEHSRTKAWGDLYAKGVRCLHCGKELNELHNEESQILGYGSGGNRELFEKYHQHAANEANYRPKDNYELQILEKERLRLEKERREMEMNEQFFYDFQDLRVIYDFDRRHAKEIKQHGIFRQGLQWTEDEILVYEQKKLVKEEVRLRREGLPETLLEDYDPLGEIENPPPTFRAIDERHYSQYQDLLYYIGRLHNFQKKIDVFKQQRFDYVQEKKTYSFILEALHQESYQVEQQLTELENDLDRTSQLLWIYAKMEKLWLQANMITNQAKKQKMKLEMQQIYYPFEIKIAKEQWQLQHYEMKNLLKTKILTEKKMDSLEKEKDYSREVFQQQEKSFEAQKQRLMVLRLCMPGNMVFTRYFGLVYIVSYRSSDDMVLVSLPFGKPRAKAYIYYREIYEIAQQRQQQELVLMEREDDRMQSFVRYEKIAIKKEIYLMAKEEENIRKIFEFHDLNQHEASLKRQAVDSSVAMAYEIAQSRRYRELQQPTVKKRVDFLVQDRLRRRKEYIGPKNNRPKPLSMYERFQHRKNIANELKQVFLSSMANEADATVSNQLAAHRKEWLLNYLFLSFIDAGVKEMIYEIAYEAIEEGKEAKLSTEKKTGIFYPQPNYMSYGTYNLLSNLWQNQKNALKQEILVNESAVQRLLLSLQAKVSRGSGKDLSNAAKEKKKWLLKNPNYNNNKKLAKAYWDVTRKVQQYQATQAANAAAGGAAAGAAASQKKKKKEGEEGKEGEEELVMDGHVVEKKKVSNYEKKKARLLLKRLKQLEIARQQRLCYEMFQEELRCKAFYAWEMKENLRERRLMKEEEKLSMTIRKEEEKLKKAIAERMLLIQRQRQQGQGQGEISLEDIDLSDLNMSSDLLAKRDLSLTYEKRRKELKDLTLERRRRQEDQRLMLLEDEASYQLRELDKIERQKKAFEQEFGKDEQDEDGEGQQQREEESAQDLLQQFANCPPGEPYPFTAAQSEKIIQSIRPNDKLLSLKLLPMPDWLQSSLPQGFQTLSTLSKNLYLKQRVTVRDKQQKILKKLAREEQRLLRLEQKSYREWEMKYRIVEQMTRKAELLMMESKEEFLLATHRLQVLQENIQKINLFCREVGEKELVVKTRYRQLQEQASLLEEEHQEASDWYELCLRRNKNRDKLKRKIVSNCRFIDSDSINGFYQRFETVRLRERVYLSYFQTIVQGIVNRSEMIATERKLLLLQHALSANKMYLINRERGMNQVKRELKCSEYLRMRRSLLNQWFFPKNRVQLLSNALKGWIRFYCWNRGQKQAYQVKFELLKRQLDLNRQFRKQLLPPDPSSSSSSSPPPPPSLMARVRERPVQCIHCFNFYLASQNTSLSCAYHPETFQLQCPESCPQPGLTALCAAHRKKRWGCCRLTDQNAIGCARRYHSPPASDPVYDYIMEKINERDAKELEELEEQVQIARQENFPDKVRMLQKNQLLTIEKDLEDARAVAARFKNLKFV